MKPFFMALCCLVLAVPGPQTFAQLNDHVQDSLALARADSTARRNANILVIGRRRNVDRLGALSKAIQATSVVTPEALFRKNADDFTQAVTSEPGVCVLTGCSSCGFKQIQINGLGANHTTMLVDGLPIYTPVTSFYGVDALTTAGVAAIDLSRGPGASLLAPGAIAGAVDVRFRDPTQTTLTADAAFGNNDWNHLSFSATTVADSGTLGILVAAHHFQQGAWDANGNGVCESPSLKDESALLRLNGIVGENWSWNLRYVHSNSEVFGAATTSNHMGAAVGPADSIPLFVGGNVKNTFIGNPVDIIEWVQTARDEAAGSLIWDSPDMGTWQLRAGLANQSQISEYEGGADYYNMDHTIVGDLRWQGSAGDHTLTLGVDGNSERMASQSIYYYQKLGITPDSYNTIFGGGYVQDVWNFGHERDLSLALRMDDIDVNWVDKPNSEIHNFIAAPRVSLRWEFLEGLTGRLSAGLGWRAPLTFFEMDHGLLDNGFDIAVDKLEKAVGVGGSLSFDGPQWNFTVGAYATQLSNLEYIDNDPTLVRPVLRNDPTHLIFVDVDAEVTFLPCEWLKLGVGAQHQAIPDQYKAVELVAAYETELNGRVELDWGPASVSGDVTWIGPRDLTQYGYADHFNVLQDGVVSDPKLVQAPGFFVANMKASWKIHHAVDLYVGAENLFNYTQARSAGDDPKFWDSQGGYGTSHIWGPLRGRQLYAGLRIVI
ncbi:MAG TPA: TonB-dependent receptor [Bacteroidota bacterium]|nr:TonB-dependent receptor [Bacteroidota bacterium]